MDNFYTSNCFLSLNNGLFITLMETLQAAMVDSVLLAFIVSSKIDYLTQGLCLHPIALQFLHPLFTVSDVLFQLRTLHPPTQLILLCMCQLEAKGVAVWHQEEEEACGRQRHC